MRRCAALPALLLFAFVGVRCQDKPQTLVGGEYQIMQQSAFQ